MLIFLSGFFLGVTSSYIVTPFILKLVKQKKVNSHRLTVESINQTDKGPMVEGTSQTDNGPMVEGTSQTNFDFRSDPGYLTILEQDFETVRALCDIRLSNYRELINTYFVDHRRLLTCTARTQNDRLENLIVKRLDIDLQFRLFLEKGLELSNHAYYGPSLNEDISFTITHYIYTLKQVYYKCTKIINDFRTENTRESENLVEFFTTICHFCEGSLYQVRQIIQRNNLTIVENGQPVNINWNIGNPNWQTEQQIEQLDQNENDLNPEEQQQEPAQVVQGAPNVVASSSNESPYRQSTMGSIPMPENITDFDNDNQSDFSGIIYQDDGCRPNALRGKDPEDDDDASGEGVSSPVVGNNPTQDKTGTSDYTTNQTGCSSSEQPVTSKTKSNKNQKVKPIKGQMGPTTKVERVPSPTKNEINNKIDSNKDHKQSTTVTEEVTENTQDSPVEKNKTSMYNQNYRVQTFEQRVARIGHSWEDDHCESLTTDTVGYLQPLPWYNASPVAYYYPIFDPINSITGIVVAILIFLTKVQTKLNSFIKKTNITQSEKIEKNKSKCWHFHITLNPYIYYDKKDINRD